MKQSLKQQFELAHELGYNDEWVNYLCSHKSDKLIAAYRDAMGRLTL